MSIVTGSRSAYAMTSFPYLGSSTNPIGSASQDPFFYERNFNPPQNCPAVTEERLILTWAHLLKRYGVEDIVLFRVGDRYIKVDFESGSIEGIASDDISENRYGTSVSLSENDVYDSTTICASLKFDVAKEAFHLRISSSLIPKTYVDTIVSTILHIVAQRLSPSVNIPFGGFSGELSVLNASPGRLPGLQLLHQVIEDKGSPFDIALEYLDVKYSTSTFSYRELDLLSTQFAQQLVVTLGDSERKHRAIPLLVPKSPELYIALFGILKAGRAFCPIPLDAPLERILYICRDVDAPFLVTTTEISCQFSDADELPNLFPITADHLVIGETSPQMQELPSCHENDLAYVMYTSGSTGVPKGVGVSHRAIMQSLYAHERHITAFKRFLQFANPTFDVFVFEFFFPLLRGVTVVAADRALLLDNLPELIIKSNVDSLELTPTVLQTVILGNKECLKNVKCLLTIGEMLTESIVTELGYDENGVGGILQGMYGPTEAAVHCAIARNFPKYGRAKDIGIPLDTVSSFVVSSLEKENPKKCEVLPLGFTGELALGGYQLADGYINRPVETAAAFISHPKYGPLYRTGDRARFLPDGRIEILGRLNAGQVKLRGMRVELGEIEATVRKAQGVHVCVASVLSHGTQLVVFVAGEPDVTVESVRTVCEKWLPSAWRPHQIKVLETIPRLASGKADRKRLEKEWTVENEELQVPNDDDDGCDGQRLAVWKPLKSVLGAGVNSSNEDSLLRDIGMDSIRAIRLAQLLREAGGNVHVSQLLQSDTTVRNLERIFLGSQARELRDTSLQQVDRELQAFQDRGLELLTKKLGDKQIKNVVDILPCTKIQAGMLGETFRNHKAYCNWVLLSVESGSSAEEVVDAIEDVINHNEILRSGFMYVESDDNFAQVVWKSVQSGQVAVKDSAEKEFAYDIEADPSPPTRFHIIESTSSSSVQISIMLHHAVYDGWSLENIVEDISLALEKKSIKKRPQYREVVLYLMGSKFDTDPLEDSLSFWREHLEYATPCQFPNMYSRTDIRTGSGRESMILSTSMKDFTSVAHQLGVTPQIIIQYAWAQLLSLYLDSQDVTFGAVVSGRTLPIDKIDEIMGPCIATLPVRVQREGPQSAREVVKFLHQHTLAVLEHSEVSLREIKQSCMRDPSRPIFDSIVVWQHTGRENPGTVLYIDGCDELEYAITIEVEPTAKDIELRITYQKERIPSSQAALILQQMDKIITGFVADPSMGYLETFGNADEGLLSIENSIPRGFAKNENKAKSLVTFVEEAAAQTEVTQSSAVAFYHSFKKPECKITRLSYQTLNEQANKLARYLLRLRGPDEHSLIAVYMEKSPQLYVSILAILKTGAGYLPLTPDTPNERLKQILETANVKILLTTKDVSDELPLIDSHETKIVCIDEVDLDGLPASNLDIVIPPSNVAYAIFTSGSTGAPKGVLVTHENIVSNILVLSDIYPCERSSKLLQFCSIAFDVSVFEIFFTWYSGMTLCSGTKDTLLADLEGAIRAMGVTHLSMTVTVAALVKPENVPSVKFLVTAGEAVTEKVFRSWADKGFYQGYGPSETTNICTLNPRMDASQHINNLGKPLANTSAFVIAARNKSFSILPRGSVGELCFGGEQVFKGYMNMPRLTSDKIFDHPEHGRIYRTGDVGRILANGDILFLSRLDDQVKIRGQRIELGEINSVLMVSNLVHDAITLLIDSATGRNESTSIVSFVTLSAQSDAATEPMIADLSDKEDTSKIVQDLHAFISGSLPHYMLPRAILPLNYIPLTANSKTDVKKLRDVFVQLSSDDLHACSKTTEIGNDTLDSWSPAEKDIAQVIADLAHTSTSLVSRNSSIYEFGLDSISAIELSRRLCILGYPALKVSQIMRQPTPATMAIVLKQQEEKVSKSEHAREPKEFLSAAASMDLMSDLHVKASDVEYILPCTPLQEAMLSAQTFQSSAAYSNHTVLRLNIDSEVFLRAWEKLVQKHEIFKTCFISSSVPNHPYLQVALKKYASKCARFQINADESAPDKVQKYIDELNIEPLGPKPPYALGLFENGQDKFLVLSMHHCLYDGYSMSLLWSDLKAICMGRDPPTREKFSTFISHMMNSDMKTSLRFWEESLRGYSPSPFPDLTGLSLAGKNKLKKDMKICTATSKLALCEIEGACSKLSVSLLSTCQATWAKLLACYTSRTDMCFGNVVSGRTIPVEGVETIIGPCFNTIPVRAEITANETNVSLFKRLHKININSSPHQLTPLRKISALESLTLNGKSLFDTLLILQPMYEKTGTELWDIVDEQGAMDVPVTIELTPNKLDDRLHITFHFNTWLINEEVARTICQQYFSVLEGSLDVPERKALDLADMGGPLLPGPSTREDDNCADPTTASLRDMLEASVIQSPTNSALEYISDSGEISKFTFENLWQQTDQIVNLLFSKQLPLGSTVAIYKNIGDAMLKVCILACLHARYAFIIIKEEDDANTIGTLNPALAFSKISHTMPDTVVVDPSAKHSIENGHKNELHTNIDTTSSDSIAYYRPPRAKQDRVKLFEIRISDLSSALRSSRDTLQPCETTRFFCSEENFIFPFLLSWISGSCFCTTMSPERLVGDSLFDIVNLLNCTSIKVPSPVLSRLRPETAPSVAQVVCEFDWIPQDTISMWEGKLWKSLTGEDGLPWSLVKINSLESPTLLGSLIDGISIKTESIVPQSCAPTLRRGSLFRSGQGFDPAINARTYANRRVQLIESELKSSLTSQGFVADLNDACMNACDQIKYVWSGSFVRHGNSRSTLVVFVSFNIPEHGATINSVWKTENWSDIEQALRAALSRVPLCVQKDFKIVPVQSLPLNSAGIIDVTSLESFFQSLQFESDNEARISDDDKAALKKTESIIRTAFSKVSRISSEKIGADATVFELGLDSITTSQVAAILRRDGLDISVVDILENPSVNRLARVIQTKNRDTKTKDSEADASYGKYQDAVLRECGLASVRDKIEYILPCTPTQEGMLSEFLRSSDGAYFNHVLYEVEEDIEMAALMEAWTAVALKTEILRTIFCHFDHVKHPFAMIVEKEGSITAPLYVEEIGETCSVESYMNKEAENFEDSFRNNLIQLPWKIVFFTGGEKLQFLFSAHHALYDAHSLELLLQDVACACEGNGIGQRKPILPLVKSILHNSSDSKALQTSRLFWEELLKNSKLCRFPSLITARSADESHISACRSVKMGLPDLEHACKESGISLHALGQAAWARVLGSYIGEDMVTFGLVLSGRQDIPGAEEAIFPCLVTLPNTANLTESNLELVNGLQRRTIDIMRNQHTPLKFIQSWRGQADQPLFETIFLFQKSPGTTGRDPKWAVIKENVSVNYAVTIEMEISSTQQLLFRATARTSLLPMEQLEILLGQIEASLLSILSQPHSLSKDFTNVAPEFLSHTPPKEANIPCEIELVHEFVERQARVTPDRIALEFATAFTDDGGVTKEEWSYAKLNEESSKIANYILARNVQLNDIIAVCLDKCAAASILFVAILKAGCGFLNLDYNSPVDRKSLIVSDSGARLVLTDGVKARELRDQVQVPVTEIECLLESVQEEPIELRRKPEIQADDLCYCLYTSGTTGTPKGCQITHRNTVQAMLAFQRLFAGHWDENSRFLQFASFHFDVSILEQFWSWSVGVCVTSAPRDLIFQDIANAIRQLQITHLDLTPSLAALISPEDCPSLCRGVFITGGEKLRRDILDKWGDKGCLYNGYGPTEVTIGCTMYPRVPVTADPSNIGPQFDNVGSFVLQLGTEKVVIRGAVGELCAYGPLVGRGYLNRENLTEERFPTLKDFNIRIYRTGDLVRVLHDNSFQFLGRADDQVKLRGQRLEISEINHVIKASDASVKDVTTLVLKHTKQQRDHLVAFIALGHRNKRVKDDKLSFLNDSETQALKENIVQHCRSKLPPYMVPTYFLFLPYLPLSPNNKVDAKLLKTLYDDMPVRDLNSGGASETESKWSQAEIALRNILCEMTGASSQDISKKSSIFELGLDSVSVISFAKRLRNRKFLSASPMVIMQNPSIHQLAKALGDHMSIDAKQMARHGELFIKAFCHRNAFQVRQDSVWQETDIEEILPCSPLQEGMLTRSLASDNQLYFNVFDLKLSTDIDLPRLRKSWETLTSRTKMLRTYFVQTPSGFAQVVHKEFSPNWVDSAIETEVADDNDWSKSPPISFRTKKSESGTILSVKIFHALYDGISMSLILEDVAKLYAKQEETNRLQFSEVLPSILSVDKTAAAAFWSDRLPKLYCEPFPTLCDNPSDGYHVVETELHTYPDIVKNSKIYKCTPLAILQAAWATLLSKYVGRSCIFGLVVSGRSLPIDGIDDCIGPLFNTIPCAVGVDFQNGTSTFEDLIREAHKFNCDSMPFQHTPLRDINKLLRVEPGKALFDSLLVFQHSPATKATELPWTLIESESIPDYPVALEINNSEDGACKLTLVAQNSVSDENLSSIIVNDYIHIIESMLRDPHQDCLSHLPKALDSGYHSPNLDSPQIGGNNDEQNFTWTQEAKVIRHVLDESFGIDETTIRADDSMFQLGLDSIDIVSLSSKLRARGIIITVSQLMKNPSIRKMTKLLQNTPLCGFLSEVNPSNKLDDFNESIRKEMGAKSFDAENIESILPTTPLQEAMVAMSISSKNRLYFNHEILELDPDLDISRFKKSWERVVSSNPILRTKFLPLREIIASSSPQRDFAQIVQKRATLSWRERQCSDSDLPATIQNTTEEHCEITDARKQTPLLLTLITTESKRQLIMSMSHALYDGFSLSLLFSDLHSVYHSDEIQSHHDYQKYLEKMLHISQDTSLEYWKGQLSSSPRLYFPRLVDGDETSTKTKRLEFISLVGASELKRFCRSQGIAEQTVGQTCWGLMLAQIHGQPDVVFGTVLACRDEEEEQNMMFPTMNTLPVRIIVHGSFRELLSDTHQNAIGAMDHKFTALRQIQKALNTGNRSLFDTLFVYQKSGSAKSSASAELWTSVDNSADIEFAVAAEMEVVGTSVIWRIAYGNLLDEEKAHNLLSSLDSVLSLMVESPDAKALTFDGTRYQFGNLPLLNSESPDTQVCYKGSWLKKQQVIEDIVKADKLVRDCDIYVIDDGGIEALIAHVFVDPVETREADLLERIQASYLQNLDHGPVPDYLVPEICERSKATTTSELKARFLSLPQKSRAKYRLAKTSKDAADVHFERTIRQAVAEVSSIAEDSIGTQQTIFHLGLDSISAIQLSSALRRRAIFLDVGEILREATVERMAIAWSKRYSRRPNVSKPTTIDLGGLLDKKVIREALAKTKISPDDVEQVIPASPGQVYLISAWQNSNGRLFYPTFVFGSAERLDMGRLLRAWSSSVEQNCLLRSTFVAMGQTDIPIAQVILKQSQHSSFGFADVSAFTRTESEDTVVKTHFDIERKILFKTLQSGNHTCLARLFALQLNNKTVLFLTIHHALYDAFSLPLLLSDLQHLYMGNQSPRSAMDSHTPYLKYLFTRDNKKVKGFWFEYLREQSSTLFEQSNRESLPLVQASRFITGAVTNAYSLEKYSHVHGLSVHSLLIAAYAKVLSRVLGKEDIVFGVYVANRHLSVPSEGWDALDMPWPTLNFVPLLAKGVKGLQLHELATNIQQDLVEIRAGGYGNVGLWKIKEWTGIEMDCFFNFVMTATKKPHGAKRADPAPSPSSTTTSCHAEEAIEMGGAAPDVDVFALEEVTVKEEGAVEDVKYEFLQPQALADNTALGALRTHLDVEIAIRDNAVDIGVFASASSATVERRVTEVSDGICEMVKLLVEAN